LTLDAPAHRTSTFLLQLLVCILSASTLATAQTNTETDPELAGDEASCLFGVDQKEINRLFSEGQLSSYLDHIGLSTPQLFWQTAHLVVSTSFTGGPTTRIQLCQRAEIHLTGPIIFTGKNQELSTQGYPDEDEKKAVVRIVGGRSGTAIQSVSVSRHS
jgi:hypothetical protein